MLLAGDVFSRFVDCLHGEYIVRIDKAIHKIEIYEGGNSNADFNY